MFSSRLKIVGLAALAVALVGFVAQAAWAATGPTSAKAVLASDDEKPKDKDASKEDRPKGFIGFKLAGNEDSGEVTVAEVFPDSPAAKAGFKEGDILLKVGDTEIKDTQAAVKAITGLKPGDKVTVKVKRDGKDKDIKVTVGKRPSEESLREKDKDKDKDK